MNECVLALYLTSTRNTIYFDTITLIFAVLCSEKYCCVLFLSPLRAHYKQPEDAQPGHQAGAARPVAAAA